MTKYLQNFIKYRRLLLELVVRDLKTKYRRSFLGFLWSLLNPLLMMLVISAVFSTLFRFDIPNFPIYLLTAQILFNFYNEATNSAMNAIIDGGSLIKKVYIPKYIFPISKVLSSFVNLLFSLVAIVIMLVITKVPITPAILLFPLPLLYVLVFSTGVGLILSALTVFFRDIQHLYGVFVTAFMYLTPIFYPVSIIPENLTPVLYNNPMFYYIQMFREVVLYGTVPPLHLHLTCIGYAVTFLLIGLVVFYKKQDKFILYI